MQDLSRSESALRLLALYGAVPYSFFLSYCTLFGHILPYSSEIYEAVWAFHYFPRFAHGSLQKEGDRMPPKAK